MYGVDIDIKYKHSKSTDFVVSYGTTIYNETSGMTTRTYYEGSTEQEPGYTAVYSGAGISHTIQSFNISVINKF